MENPGGSEVWSRRNWWDGRVRGMTLLGMSAKKGEKSSKWSCSTNFLVSYNRERERAGKKSRYWMIAYDYFPGIEPLESFLIFHPIFEGPSFSIREGRFTQQPAGCSQNSIDSSASGEPVRVSVTGTETNKHLTTTHPLMFYCTRSSGSIRRINWILGFNSKYSDSIIFKGL